MGKSVDWKLLSSCLELHQQTSGLRLVKKAATNGWRSHDILTDNAHALRLVRQSVKERRRACTNRLMTFPPHWPHIVVALHETLVCNVACVNPPTAVRTYTASTNVVSHCACAPSQLLQRGRGNAPNNWPCYEVHQAGRPHSAWVDMESSKKCVRNKPDQISHQTFHKFPRDDTCGPMTARRERATPSRIRPTTHLLRCCGQDCPPCQIFFKFKCTNCQVVTVMHIS